MDIPIFPEDVNAPRSSPRALQLKYVLSIVYAFGGVAGVLALLSKFIVTPLFEQLTYDRRMFARSVLENQRKLNIKLSQIVSKVPKFDIKNPDLQYRERVVSTRPRTNKIFDFPLPHDEKQAFEKHEKTLQELSLLIRESDPNNEIFSTNSQIITQSEEMIKYTRKLQYDSSPSLYSLPGVNEDKRTPFLKSAYEFKQEIRAVKSALLSS